MTVAFFRPDDERAESAAALLRRLGADPLSDPMLAVEPTGAVPRSDAEYTVLTSKTGAELVAEAGWTPHGAVVAIGAPTAEALEAAGYAVDRLPSEFSSSGLVAELAPDAPGSRIEVARSDHGSPVLLEGLNDAGAYVHETVLYRLVRPEGAGESVRAAATGDLEGACFTSSLTVEHFLEAAAERGVRADAIEGLNDAVVGAIGEPTRATATECGIDVDVVPETAEFDALAEAVLERIDANAGGKEHF
jgi:uroporphyrinogen-III synthase